MRILQTIIQKLACVAVLAGGAALAIFSVSGLYQTVVVQLPGPNPMLRIAIGVAAAVLAVFALLPLGGGRRRSRELRFNAGNGPVTIQLDPLASSLNKTFNKVPVVKKGTVRLTPTKAADKANVHADVHLLNPADASVRETSIQLKTYLDELARSVIGAEEVGEVAVNIVNTETAEQPASTLKSSAPIAEVATPVARTIPEPEPIVEEPMVVEDEAPVSEDLVTYEESVQAAEEEERSLTGEAEDEPELPVAWETEEPDTEDTAIVLEEGEESSDEDTSFDALAIEESTKDEEDDENRPASGV
ncbi:MAG: hypothetical protein AMXMBFR82_36850 [Candidatus Hydrogenedentota bacterium]